MKYIILFFARLILAFYILAIKLFMVTFGVLILFIWHFNMTKVVSIMDNIWNEPYWDTCPSILKSVKTYNPNYYSKSKYWKYDSFIDTIINKRTHYIL